jgi:uncharacterized integral membrane protein
MGNVWLKIKIWTKIVIFLLVVVYLLCFLLMNWKREAVELWFFYNTRPQLHPLIWVLITFLAGALTAILLRTTLTTIRQISELRRRQHEERAERALAEKEEQERKAAMLQNRPRATPATQENEPLA